MLGALQSVSDFKRRAREAERAPVYTYDALKSAKALFRSADDAGTNRNSLRDGDFESKEDISVSDWVSPHVNFVLVLMRDSESETLMECERRIDLHDCQSYGFRFLSAQLEKSLDNAAAYTLSLHHWCDIN